jgi:hypothetical protein
VKGTGRTRADEVLAAELARGATVVEASTTAGISEATAYRRLQQKDFQTRVSELRSQMVRNASGRLADGMVHAALVLRRLLGSKTETVQLRAATAVLEQAVRIAELTELQEKVAELQEAFKRQAK